MAGTRGNDLRAREITLMLSLTILVLFVSTTIYTAFSLSWASAYIQALSGVIFPTNVFLLLQTSNCMKTATLTINVWVLPFHLCTVLLIRLCRLSWETQLYAGEHMQYGKGTDSFRVPPSLCCLQHSVCELYLYSHVGRIKIDLTI